MELDSLLFVLECATGLAAVGSLGARLPRRFVSVKVRQKRLAALTLAAVPAFVGLEWGKRFEPYFPEVTRTALPIVDAPLRVVLLSDFHAGRMRRSDLAKAVALTNAEAPDVVLLGGDYISGYELTVERREALEGLRGLNAPRGVFAVMGNHDSEPFGDDIPRRSAVADVLRGFGYRVLANEAANLGPVWIVGLEDVQAGRTDVVAARRAVPAGAKIVYLAHDWHALPTERIELGLVGHTHGGQVCFPFTALCAGPTRDRPFVRGKYSWPEGGVLFVTRGLGLAKAPIRFGCRPEVALLELGRR